MLIAVDIGNTNIALGLLDGTDIVGTYRIATQAYRTCDEYGIILNSFIAMSGYTTSDVHDVIIASVVPKVLQVFRQSIAKFFKVSPMIIGPGIKTGINIRIDDPRTLGADCLTDCVGAYFLYGGPVLVADFGTATTFNHVNEKGIITCGLISPGIETSAQTLWGTTAQLPEVEITHPSTILATNTKAAMQAGLYYGFLGSIEGIIRQFKREIDTNLRVIATGGLSTIFKGATECIDIYDPDLMFKGMALIYARNN